MVKVHIWLSHNGQVGHTSLTVGTTYISFWPSDDTKDKKQPSAKDVFIRSRHQKGALRRNIQEDIKLEGNRQPSHTIILAGLDEKKMLEYYSKLRVKIPRYQLAKNNCSDIVAQALIIGSGIEPSFTPDAANYHKWGDTFLGKNIWTPYMIKRYANELKNNTGKGRTSSGGSSW